MTKPTPRKAHASYVPLVDAHTPGLYRDETFWQFHYQDPVARARAQVEYELACLDPDPEKAMDKLLAESSDTSPAEPSRLSRLFSHFER